MHVILPYQLHNFILACPNTMDSLIVLMHVFAASGWKRFWLVSKLGELNNIGQRVHSMILLGMQTTFFILSRLESWTLFQALSIPLVAHNDEVICVSHGDS